MAAVTDMNEVTTKDGNIEPPADVTSIITIVVASVIGAVIVGAIIGLVYMMKRNRSVPIHESDLYPSQPAGRFTRRGDPELFRQNRAQQSLEDKLTHHAQDINVDEAQRSTFNNPSNSYAPIPRKE